MLHKIIDSDGFNAVVHGRHGFQVYNKNDIYIGRSIEKYGEFSEGETDFFRQLCRAGDIAVEVGANIGTHTLPLSHFVGTSGRVIAFEPQRIVFQTLCATLAINSVSNVEAYQMGVGSEKSEVLIPEIRYDTRGNFGGVSIDGFNEGAPVPVIKLDDFLSGIPRLRLLKIDVEGMEKSVLEGAGKLISAHKPFLYVENDRIEKSRELIEAIFALDYRLFWHFPRLFSPNNFAGDTENVFGGTISINMIGFHRSADVKLDGFQEVTDPENHPLRKADS